MKIISTHPQLELSYRQSLEILGKMRRYQKEWEENYGCAIKERKKYWEAKADEYLADLGGQPIIEIR